MGQIYVAIVTAFKTSVSSESELCHLASYVYILLITYVIRRDIFEI